jgi:hypothetical protein
MLTQAADARPFGQQRPYFRSLLKDHLRPTFGNVVLGNTRGDIGRWRNERLTAGPRQRRADRLWSRMPVVPARVRRRGATLIEYGSIRQRHAAHRAHRACLGHA